MKRLTLQDFQNRLNMIHPKEKLIALEWTSGRENAIVKCATCGQIFVKKGEYFLDKRKVSICKKCFPTQSNVLKENFILPQGYSYVEKYNGMHNKILIKHSCGFIWKITPANLKLGKGCPKCNKKISKGEQKIIQWLNDNKIEYIYQYPIKINNSNLYVDFYLPKYNLYIEYNGEQHYQKINYFGGLEKFKKQLYNDNLKRSFLAEKLIEIPYTYFENIEEILKSSTTIPKGSKQQAMAAEVEKLLQKSKI